MTEGECRGRDELLSELIAEAEQARDTHKEQAFANRDDKAFRVALGWAATVEWLRSKW